MVVTRIEDMTPEQVAEHISDATWRDVLEVFIDDCLERGDSQSLKVAYAFNSSIIQAVELANLYAQAQTDVFELFDHAQRLRAAFAAKDLMNPALIEYDLWMTGAGMLDG